MKTIDEVLNDDDFPVFIPKCARSKRTGELFWLLEDKKNDGFILIKKQKG